VRPRKIEAEHAAQAVTFRICVHDGGQPAGGDQTPLQSFSRALASQGRVRGAGDVDQGSRGAVTGTAPNIRISSEASQAW
jgi:hypothetical protein